MDAIQDWVKYLCPMDSRIQELVMPLLPQYVGMVDIARLELVQEELHLHLLAQVIAVVILEKFYPETIHAIRLAAMELSQLRIYPVFLLRLPPPLLLLPYH